MSKYSFRTFFFFLFPTFNLSKTAADKGPTLQNFLIVLSYNWSLMKHNKECKDLHLDCVGMMDEFVN